jgi:N-acetylglucosamine kinase-like BadF-type ATPase
VTEIGDLFLTGEPSVSGRRSALLVQSALLIATPAAVARRDLQNYMEARNARATLDVAMNEARRWFAERGLGISLDPRTGRYAVIVLEQADEGEAILEELDATRLRIRKAIAAYRRAGHAKAEVFNGILTPSLVRSGAVFPPGSSLHALYSRHRFAPLIKLLEGITPVTGRPVDDPAARVQRLPSRANRATDYHWTVAALDAGLETVRIYSRAPGDDQPNIEEFTGAPQGAEPGPLASTRRALELLADRAGTTRRDRVVCVVALGALMRHNDERTALDVKDLIFDSGLRGGFFIVNDSIPPLLAKLAGLQGVAHSNVSVKVGSGSVVTALVPSAPGAATAYEVKRFGGAEHLFTDQGSGFQIALQAFRTSISELYDVAFGDRTEPSKLALAAARFVALRQGVVGGEDGRPPDLAEAIRSIETASGRWSSDPGMKRRVSAFTRVVCDLADEGEPDSRQIVRRAAIQLGHLTALAARQVGEPPVVDVVGKIPSGCTSYRLAFVRSVRDNLAGTGLEPAFTHRSESIESAHLFAQYLYERFVSGGGNLALSDVVLPDLAGYLQVVQ